MSEKKARKMGMDFRVPMDIHLLVPWRYDSMLNPPIGYSAIYHDQLKASNRFLLLLLLIEVMIYYNIALTQLVSNVIKVVVRFERICRMKRVISSLALFTFFFILKVSSIPNYELSWSYQFSP